MVIKHSAGLIILLSLIGCQTTSVQPTPSAAVAEGDWTLPYGDWSFEFFYPNALPAVVNHVRIVDTAGDILAFNRLDITEYDPESQGHWSNVFRSAQRPYLNNASHPPQYMIFCWDSIIDKKTYETSMFFPKAVWQRMLTPATHKARSGNTVWYKTMLFGLAPEGKVSVWLQDVGNYPNYPVPVTDLKTVSGDKLDVCKGITKHPDGYVYYGNTPDFIKGKTYPYGTW